MWGGGHDDLFNEHFNARYARLGNCKLVSLAADTTWHLYNLAIDRTETTDLKSQNPAKVKQLDSLWHHWANTHMVYPKPKHQGK